MQKAKQGANKKRPFLRQCSVSKTIHIYTSHSIWVFPKMPGFPKHPKSWSFLVGKPKSCWGFTHHFRKPPPYHQPAIPGPQSTGMLVAQLLFRQLFAVVGNSGTMAESINPSTCDKKQEKTHGFFLENLQKPVYPLQLFTKKAGRETLKFSALDVFFLRICWGQIWTSPVEATPRAMM